MEIDRDRTDAPEDRPADAGENERRSSYLGFVAHEVRNPLSTALWTAELLARMSSAERGGPRGEKLSAMCLRSLARVRQLIEDHFLCERLDVAGIPVRVEPLSVREVIDGLVEKRPRDAPEVRVDVDPAFAVAVDRSLLERVLDSLLSAVAAEAGPISVDAAGDEGTIRIALHGPARIDSSLEDPRKGSPSDSRGRALAVPLARRAARALAGTLAVEDGAYVLTLDRARAYTPPPPSDLPPHS
jgi:signal transduction histidine kinase